MPPVLSLGARKLMSSTTGCQSSGGQAASPAESVCFCESARGRRSPDSIPEGTLWWPLTSPLLAPPSRGRDIGECSATAHLCQAEGAELATSRTRVASELPSQLVFVRLFLLGMEPGCSCVPSTHSAQPPNCFYSKLPSPVMQGSPDGTWAFLMRARYTSPIPSGPCH